MKYLCLIALLFTFTGCSTNAPAPTAPRVEVSATAAALAPTPEQEKLTDLQKHLKDAETAETKAVADGKAIDRLSAEKDILQTRTQIAEEQSRQLLQNVEAYKRQITDTDKAIEAQQIKDLQGRLYFYAMILGLLALVAGAVAYGWPLLRSVALWATAIISALATLLAVAAKLLPLIYWIGDLIPYLGAVCAVVIAGYGLVALRHWWLAHHTSQQLITYVEAAKPKAEADLEAYKTLLRTHLDSPVEDFIWKTKQGLGLGPKAAPAVPLDPPAGTSKPTA